jgi:fibronectin type 3 domain-containing protein
MPSPPTVSYDEQRVLVEWPASGETDPSAHHVYEVGRAGEQVDAPDRKLTTEPVTGASFEDARVEWGVRRCYAIRAVVTVDAGAVESDASPSACVEMADTFAPPPPTGLTAVSSVGAVSLIWDATTVSDLSGYLVLKGPPGGPLAPVTPGPVAETTYRDQASPGTRVAYAVQAVDKAGNISAPSSTVEETSR